MLYVRFVFALTSIATLPAAELELSDKFYNAIRHGDESVVRHLLKSGADVNVKDKRGATPLHYAAEVGTPDMMRLLLDAGADINARTAFGATPLLWSAVNEPKVRLLVDRAADVNARTRRGNTPLLVAAAQAGNVNVVRFLLDHGAALDQATNVIGQTPLMRAAQANDVAIVKLLLSRVDNAKTRDAQGATPLMSAAAEGNVAMMQLLLAKGADVNAQMEPHPSREVKNGPIDTGRLSPLMLAANFSRNPAAVRLLLEAGADVNAQDVRGMTPLMLAVASDHADPEIVQLLLARKPNVTMKSKFGETPLAWATKFQHPAILPGVQKASGVFKAPMITPTTLKHTDVRDIRRAAEKSLALVQKTTTSFFLEGGCVGCHAQHIAGMATAIARSKGLQYDEAAASEVLRATRLEFASRADQFLEREDGPAEVILTGALVTLAFQNVPADRMTDAMIRSVASQQMLEGNWNSIGIVRPPTADGHFSVTAAAIRALQQYGSPALKEEMQERIARATKWITQAKAQTTEDAVMQLLGAKWGGTTDAMLRRFTSKVLSLQRKDGGWGQLPQLPDSDAYATATALYALNEAGGMPPSHVAYQRGTNFLLDTQAADGSWHVVSRAPKFQPYFESGFPYGHDQWISQWATGWASIALQLAVPENVARK